MHSGGYYVLTISCCLFHCPDVPCHRGPHRVGKSTTHTEQWTHHVTAHSLKLSTYTLCPKKGSHLMFNSNFGKCGLIFKILSQIDQRENSLFRHYKNVHLTCSMLLHYLVKF